MRDTIWGRVATGLSGLRRHIVLGRSGVVNGRADRVFGSGALALMLACCVSLTAGAQVLDFGGKLFADLNLGEEVEGYTPPAGVTYGVTFSPRVTGAITHLGAFDAPGSQGFDTGLPAATRVDLRNAIGDLLASVTIPAGDTGYPLRGGFRYAELSSPIFLAGGDHVRVEATCNDVTTILGTTTSSVTWGTAFNSSQFDYVSMDPIGGVLFPYPASVSFVALPEPAYLGAAVLLPLFVMARRWAAGRRK